INGIEAMAGVSEESRDLLISARKGDAEDVRVAVADTGPGLAAGAPEQVFAAFYTTKPGGLGLGLSICRSIIEAHDGRLWASANEGRGAVLQFTLPAEARWALLHCPFTRIGHAVRARTSSRRACSPSYRASRPRRPARRPGLRSARGPPRSLLVGASPSPRATTTEAGSTWIAAALPRPLART